MKIFNINLTLAKKDSEYGVIENYPGYLRKKLLQLLIMIVIYFVLFYTLNFFSTQFDKLTGDASTTNERQIINE